MELPDRWQGKTRVLIADDEPDIHAVTKLSLKGLSRKISSLELLSSFSGAETLDALRRHPDIGLVLLDVVMETDSSGLDVCRAIRGELGNQLVRIVLRTGQPGVAPEQQMIDTYDIDGYLAKAETSSSRLYTTVRCALKSHQELVSLERHRQCLTAAHDCALSLSAASSVDQILQPILRTVLAICASSPAASPALLAALQLETFEDAWGPRQLFLYLTTDADRTRAQVAAEKARARAQRASSSPEAAGVEDGLFVPLQLHEELGRGWMFVDGLTPDELTRRTVTLLAGHAQNAIYASLALGAARDRKRQVFEELAI